MKQLLADILRRRRLLAILVLLALLLLVILMPLRAALWAVTDSAQGFVTARETRGTIWSGRAFDLQMAGLSFGDVETDLSFWPLLLARGELGMERPAVSGQRGVKATLLSVPGGSGVKAMNGELPVSGPLGNIPVTSWKFENFHARFDGEQCADAGGNVQMMIGPGAWSALNLESGLLAQARCDGKALHLPLLSPSTMEKIDLRIFADGTYEAKATIDTADPEISAMLGLAGFAPISGGYTMTSKGSL